MIKQKMILLIVLAMFTLLAHSQTNYFIYLFNGQKKDIKSIEYKKSFLDYDYFLIDSVKINPNTIKFYNDALGFHAYIGNIYLLDGCPFANRIIQGKINVYEYIETNFYSNGVGNSSSSKSILFYNRDYQDVKEVSYRNLINDLNDNSESVRILNEYHKESMNQLKCYFLGSAFVIAAIAVLSKQIQAVKSGESKSQQHYSITGSLFGGGLACIGIGVVYHFKKGDKLNLAIEAYNK